MPAHYAHTGFGAWLCERHVQRPLLPTDILVRLAEEICLPALLLKELHGNLAAPPGLVGAVYGPAQRMGLLLDEGFEVDIVNGRQGEVEQVAGEGRDGGEVAVEEDGVEDCWAG